MTIILSLLPQKSLPWYFFYDNTFLADDNISLDNTTSLDNTASLIDISLNKSSNEPQTSVIELYTVPTLVWSNQLTTLE